MHVQCSLLFKPPFFYTSENENPELYKKWVKVCNFANLPPGKICNERAKSAMLQTFPHGVGFAMLQVCNVADLPGEVCNVADFPGGRSARGKVCNTTPGYIISKVVLKCYKNEYSLSMIWSLCT